jgi:hypothetical protein
MSAVGDRWVYIDRAAVIGHINIDFWKLLDGHLAASLRCRWMICCLWITHGFNKIIVVLTNERHHLAFIYFLIFLFMFSLSCFRVFLIFNMEVIVVSLVIHNIFLVLLMHDLAIILSVFALVFKAWINKIFVNFILCFKLILDFTFQSVHVCL